MAEQRWISRQRDAAMGYVPIIAVAVATSIGAGISDALGLTVWPGVIVFGAAGFFLSRAVLRWYFRPHPQTAENSPSPPPSSSTPSS